MLSTNSMAVTCQFTCTQTVLEFRLNPLLHNLEFHRTCTQSEVSISLLLSSGNPPDSSSGSCVEGWTTDRPSSPTLRRAVPLSRVYIQAP